MQEVETNCSGKTQLFFAKKPEAILQAVDLCNECSFYDLCLTIAKAIKPPYGVWAGDFRGNMLIETYEDAKIVGKMNGLQSGSNAGYKKATGLC